MKIYSSDSNPKEVIEDIELRGFALFSCYKTIFELYLKEKLAPFIKDTYHPAFINHPEEGYLYVIYDSDYYKAEDLQEMIIKNLALS